MHAGWERMDGCSSTTCTIIIMIEYFLLPLRSQSGRTITEGLGGFRPFSVLGVGVEREGCPTSAIPGAGDRTRHCKTVATREQKLTRLNLKNNVLPAVVSAGATPRKTRWYEHSPPSQRTGRFSRAH